MKKNILKSAVCFLLLGLAFSCSTDNDVVIEQPSEKNLDGFQQKDASVWNGTIGIERNGAYEVTANPAPILAEFEAILAEEGNPVKLTHLTIQKRIATNDPSSEAYFLIGGTPNIGSGTTSIAKRVTKSGYTFTISPGVGGGPGKSVSCRGCGTGCFLEYYQIDGHYVAYCDSAGCGSDCTKSESR